MPLTALEQAEYDVLIRFKADAQERVACENSLLTFFERAWREIDPAELAVNWHHIEICNALEDITWGRNRSLIINIPPRHTKSLLVNIIWCAWTWAQPQERKGPLAGPQVKFLCVSYGAILAERMGLTMKRLIESEWYQRHWGERVILQTDQSSRADFGNTAGGERISNSIEGGILGRGGDCIVGETLVHTERGARRVDELDISAAPEYILSYAPGTKTPAYRRLVAVARRSARRTWRVHTRHGHVVEATGDHPFLTGRGWVQAMALAVGDVLLRCVPQGGNPPGQRDGQVGPEEKIGPVLQPELRHDPEEFDRRKIALALPSMRQAPAIEGQASCVSLQQGMSSSVRSATGRETENDPAAPLRDMRDDLQATDNQDTGAVLLDGLFWRGPLGDNQGHGEPRISARHRPASGGLSGLARREGTRVRARCEPLPSLWCDGTVTGSSHQSDPHGSAAAQFGAPVQDMPSGPARWRAFKAEEDTVSLVESVGGDQDREVFDVQVEGTPWFFADGILVHNCTIIDDPQTRRGADSEVERAASIQGMSDLTTRVTDPRISAQVLIQQRLHVNDATDWALKNWRSDREWLMYPARFDPDRACVGDPRTYRGELLWPEVWSDDELRNIEAGLKALDGDRLSDYAVAGQLQQNPIPKGGGIIKREWIEAWPPSLPDGSFPQDMVNDGRIRYPAFEYVAACVDTAFTAKQANDRSAMVVIGIFRAEGTGRIERRGDGTMVRVADDYGFPKALIMYGWAKRLELHGPPEVIPAGMEAGEWRKLTPAVRARIRALIEDGESVERTSLITGFSKIAVKYFVEGGSLREETWGLVETVDGTCKRYRVDHLTILTLGQGHGLEQELRRLHSDGAYGVSMEAETGDKEARAYAVQHLFSARQIYAPMYEDGALPTWLDPLLDELCLFPRGQHDDFVDATVGCLRHLRQIGLMERREEFDRDEQRSMRWETNRRVQLPYEV